VFHFLLGLPLNAMTFIRLTSTALTARRRSFFDTLSQLGV